tara:strand:+ start:330 stop:677 length:348 start_codon:yes stop_codon:yes gene_type:complete
VSKKLTNKFLIKTYYNLLLIKEIKENSFKNINDPLYSTAEYRRLADLDLQELNECIAAFRQMVDDASDEAYFLNTSLTHLLEEDPYYKIVKMVYDSEGENNKFRTLKKIDKKLMN